MSLTSKQRSKLKSIAANIQPVGQIVKVSILENAEGDPQSLGRELAARLGAECVIVIGRKAVLYRRSPRKNFEHIQLD